MKLRLKGGGGPHNPDVDLWLNAGIMASLARTDSHGAASRLPPLYYSGYSGNVHNRSHRGGGP